METTKKTIKKAIIVVSGIANIGKTPAIRKVYDVLNSTPRYKTIDGPYFSGEDIEVTLKYYTKLIGISSMGDPNSDLFNRLKSYAKNNCDVILTASRTSGSTVADIVKIANKYGYEIIWTSHYHHDKGTEIMPNGANLNEIFARGMVDLIRELLK